VICNKKLGQAIKNKIRKKVTPINKELLKSTFPSFFRTLCQINIEESA